MQVCENYVLALKGKKCIWCSLLITRHLSSVQMHGCVFPCTRRKWSVSLPYSCDSTSSEQAMTDGTLGLEFTRFLKSHVLAGGHGSVSSHHFTPKISLCWFILEQIKTIAIRVCIYYYYLKKNLRYFLLFFHSCLPPQTSPAHPGETFFMLRACIVWMLASAQGLPGGRQQLSQKYCGSTGLGALSKERVERQFFCFWLLTSFRVAVLFSSGLFVFTGCPLLTLGLFSLPCNTNILRR